MTEYSTAEKTLMTLAAFALLISVYVLAQGRLSFEKVRTGMPVGKIELAKGDTRWKAGNQTRHYRTWPAQRIYVGDTLYAGKAGRLAFHLGEIRVDLQADTKLTIAPIEEKMNVDAAFGEFEVYLPAGARLRVSAHSKFLDIASVNGGRALAKVEADRTLRIQNLDGDLVVRTEGKREHKVSESQAFVALK